MHIETYRRVKVVLGWSVITSLLIFGCLAILGVWGVWLDDDAIWRSLATVTVVAFVCSGTFVVTLLLRVRP